MLDLHVARALCLLLACALGLSCAASPLGTAERSTPTTTATAASIVDRMVDAVERQTAPYRRTYEIEGWIASRDAAREVFWAEQHGRFVHTYQPPDALQQDYEDLLTTSPSQAHTLTIGSAVYTLTKAGWVCARTPNELRITADQVLSKQALEPLRAASARVSVDRACGARGCDRLVAEFRDDLSALPSAMRIELAVDRGTSLPASYSTVRVYDGGKQARVLVRFEFSLAEHLSGPAASCPSSSG